jgi:hypothetical protein
MVVDSKKLTDLCWQFQAPLPNTSCAASVTIDNVRFYSAGTTDAGGKD